MRQRLPVVVHANVPGDRVEPRQHRFAGAVGVPHLVNAQPGFLQQVVGISPAGELDEEKPMQLRAQAMDQCRGRGEITPLITGHQHFQIAVRVHSGAAAHPIITRIIERACMAIRPSLA